MSTKNYITELDVDEGLPTVQRCRPVKGHCKMRQAWAGSVYELGSYGLDSPSLTRDFGSSGCSS